MAEWITRQRQSTDSIGYNGGYEWLVLCIEKWQRTYCDLIHAKLPYIRTEVIDHTRNIQKIHQK